MCAFVQIDPQWAIRAVGGGLLGSAKEGGFLSWEVITLKKNTNKSVPSCSRVVVPSYPLKKAKQKEYVNCLGIENGSSLAFHFHASSQTQAMRWFFLSLLCFFFLWAPSSSIVTPASFMHSVPSCHSAKTLHLCLNQETMGFPVCPFSWQRLRASETFFSGLMVLIPFPLQSVILCYSSWL